MRVTRWMPCVIALSALACSSSLTSPPRGLPVTLTAIAPDPSVTSSITGSGDVVTAVAANYEGVCGTPPVADAGIRANELVITISSTVRHVECIALVARRAYSVTVDRVPADVRSAKLVIRLVNGHTESDTVLVETPLRLP